MRQFQITEDDLAELERTLPQFADALFPVFADQPAAGNKLRTQIRRVQQIMLNVRWNYGPPSEVHRVPADQPDDS